MTHARIPDFSRPAPTDASSAQRRTPTDGRFRALPNEPLPGEEDAWEFLEAVRPETAHSHGFRFLDIAGELLTAVVLIAGGVFAYGYIPTL